MKEKEVSKEEWQHMFDKLHAKALMAAGHEDRVHYFLSISNVPFGNSRGRKRWRPKSNVIQLYHYLDIPCNELPKDEEVHTICLAVVETPDGEASFFIGEHNVGECPHKEDDPEYGRIHDGYEEYACLWA